METSDIRDLTGPHISNSCILEHRVVMSFSFSSVKSQKVQKKRKIQQKSHSLDALSIPVGELAGTRDILSGIDLLAPGPGS